jgi:hypothetical protein
VLVNDPHLRHCPRRHPVMVSCTAASDGRPRQMPRRIEDTRRVGCSLSSAVPNLT